MRQSVPNMLRASALFVSLMLSACQPPDRSNSAENDVEPRPEADAARQPVTSRLTADTPSTTAAGNTFVAPAGWSVTVKGQASILEAPEGNSRIVLVDVQAKQHDRAIEEAWTAYRPSLAEKISSPIAGPDKNGWTDRQTYWYPTSSNEHRTIKAVAMHHGDQWIVSINDVDNGVAQKRLADIALIFDTLLPKGYSLESFTGRKANVLDETRIKELTDFVKQAQEALGIPGASLGLIQDGRTVFAGGFGVKEIGEAEKPDADTLYLIASDTKQLTTLMLAKLVDEGRLAWETPAVNAFPQFKFGDASTTRKVQIKDLVCMCTGLPTTAFEWLLEFEDLTPETTIATIGTIPPTSDFGEVFQYSNLMAAAAGFIGGHVLLPDKELGAAYDEAMQSLVFDPLAMSSSTFDFKRALNVNHASGHTFNMEGKPTLTLFRANYAIVPLRPAGGAWSSVNDLLKYVAMELAEGNLPDGSRYISTKVLNERTVPRVRFGGYDSYDMGLITSTKYGVRVVYHPGSMFGYRSLTLWLPEYGVGAVLLTNADAGTVLWSAFPRKLLEVLFDGKPQADDDVRVEAKVMRDGIASGRASLTIPPGDDAFAKLGDKYTSPALGDIAVSREGKSVIFDFGEWATPVASRKNPDGTTSFITIVPGFQVQFVAGEADGRRVLRFHDAQHEYVFHEQ